MLEHLCKVCISRRVDAYVQFALRNACAGFEDCVYSDVGIHWAMSMFFTILFQIILMKSEFFYFYIQFFFYYFAI